MTRAKAKGGEAGDPVKTDRLTDPERMVDAAIACFRRHGPLKTSMEDIAREAKVGRQTVYRTFRNRTDLLDAVVTRRLRELAARIRPVVDGCEAFEEALVQGSLETMRLARRDRLFIATLESAADHGVERYLIDPRSPVQGFMLSIWGAAFARARHRGELRPELTDTELADWLRAVHLILLLREDLKPDGQEMLVRRMVAPGLMPPRALPRPRESCESDDSAGPGSCVRKVPAP